jgi:hypothetical protein
MERSAMFMKRALSVRPRLVNPSAMLPGIETAARTVTPIARLPWGAPILESPDDRRDEFVEPYFRHARPLYLAVTAALDNLVEAVGLKAA